MTLGARVLVIADVARDPARSLGAALLGMTGLVRIDARRILEPEP